VWDQNFDYGKILIPHPYFLEKLPLIIIISLSLSGIIIRMNLYHITTQTAWEQAKTAGEYRAPSLASEGFIHTSTLPQVLGTANLLFRGQTNLVLLVLDPAKISPMWRFDPVTTHGALQQFPHVYGPINLSAVAEVIPFPASADGSFTLPPQLTPDF
jgi:uncharacterized protein (DUF952 family)